MKRTAFLIALLALTSLCGCAIKAKFVPTSGFEPGSRTPAQIEIFMLEDAPKRPHRIVGPITTNWPWKGIHASPEKVIQSLRVEASQRGLDGVRDVRFVGPGIVGKGLASGTGFVYEE